MGWRALWVDSKQKTVGRYDSDIAARAGVVPALPSILRVAILSSSDAFSNLTSVA